MASGGWNVTRMGSNPAQSVGIVLGIFISCLIEYFQRVLLPEQEASLQDGAGARPSYNLRTLCRALEYARATAPTYGLPRALYDGGAMSFSTQLAAASAAVLHRLLRDHFLLPRGTDVCFPCPWALLSRPNLSHKTRRGGKGAESRQGHSVVRKGNRWYSIQDERESVPAFLQGQRSLTASLECVPKVLSIACYPPHHFTRVVRCFLTLACCKSLVFLAQRSC